MNEFHFREWLVLEFTQNPRILLPYVKHLMEQRLAKSRMKNNYEKWDKKSKMPIRNDGLRHDYAYAMEELESILSGHATNLQVMYRLALRNYERNRDHIAERARIDEDYAIDLQDTHADSDMWVFVEALEDMLHGKIPDLENLL